MTASSVAVSWGTNSHVFQSRVEQQCQSDKDEDETNGKNDCRQDRFPQHNSHCRVWLDIERQYILNRWLHTLFMVIRSTLRILSASTLACFWVLVFYQAFTVGSTGNEFWSWKIPRLASAPYGIFSTIRLYLYIWIQEVNNSIFSVIICFMDWLDIDKGL